mgnify:CR=1
MTSPVPHLPVVSRNASIDSSNSIVHNALGFRNRPNIGAFVFLPDFFVGLAILVLLYQSQT